MTRADLLRHVADEILAVQRDHPLRVGIDGVDAAGKTTLADELVAELRDRGREVLRASIDGFHNPAAIRRQRGSMSPEGYYADSFNYAALRRALLDPLGSDGSRRYRRRVFDYRTDAPVDSTEEEAAADSILLFDGVFLLRPELRECWDYSVFLRADFRTTLRRAQTRDISLFGTVEAIRKRYDQRYIPGQQIYLKEARPESFASLVIDNNQPSAPRIVETLP